MDQCRECSYTGDEDLVRVTLKANRKDHVPNYFTVCRRCLGAFISENWHKFIKAEVTAI